MTDEELRKLAELMAAELSSTSPLAIAGMQLSTLDVFSNMKCCQGKCGCNPVCGCHGDMGCGCNPKCGCDDVTNFMGPLDWLTQLSNLPKEELKTILQAAPLIEKVRSGDFVSPETGGKPSTPKEIK